MIGFTPSAFAAEARTTSDPSNTVARNDSLARITAKSDWTKSPPANKLTLLP